MNSPNWLQLIIFSGKGKKIPFIIQYSTAEKLVLCSITSTSCENIYGVCCVVASIYTIYRFNKKQLTKCAFGNDVNVFLLISEEVESSSFRIVDR